MHSCIGYPSVNMKTRNHFHREDSVIYKHAHSYIINWKCSLQQRHMPYIAVSAGLIHTMQFHLPRTVATVLNQGLGYGFNLQIRTGCFKISVILLTKNKMLEI